MLRYHRDTSPNMDTIARQGVRFENLYASDVPCLPSRQTRVVAVVFTKTAEVSHAE